jgi:hypothetical protein
MSTRRPPTIETSRAMQRVLACLKTRGDMTPEQISEHAHVAITTLTKGGHLRAMETQGLIHVCEWAPPRVSGMWGPIWRAGKGRSAPRPARASNTEYARRWRHKRGNGLKIVQRQAARLPWLMTLAGALGV